MTFKCRPGVRSSPRGTIAAADLQPSRFCRTVCISAPCKGWTQCRANTPRGLEHRFFTTEICHASCYRSLVPPPACVSGPCRRQPRTGRLLCAPLDNTGAATIWKSGPDVQPLRMRRLQGRPASRFRPWLPRMAVQENNAAAAPLQPLRARTLQRNRQPAEVRVRHQPDLPAGQFRTAPFWLVSTSRARPADVSPRRRHRHRRHPTAGRCAHPAIQHRFDPPNTRP